MVSDALLGHCIRGRGVCAPCMGHLGQQDGLRVCPKLGNFLVRLHFDLFHLAPDLKSIFCSHATDNA